MSLNKQEARKMLQRKMDNGNASISVSTKRQKKLLRELLQVANTDSFSQDIYQAIDFYLELRDEYSQVKDRELKEKYREAVHGKYTGGN